MIPLADLDVGANLPSSAIYAIVIAALVLLVIFLCLVMKFCEHLETRRETSNSEKKSRCQTKMESQTASHSV